MTVPWETVRIFISSTFDDMHAERDYLVKQVFPELREWCERRKLRLVDIDLRWGVKEEDTQNRNVVEVCLRRIDEARPFFLCFLGQRRGWVPGEGDISPSTLAADAYPDLKDSVGKASVTEMEILHALVKPFHTSRAYKEQPAEYYQPVRYALFYLRQPAYLDQLPGDFPSLHKVYTNAGIEESDARLQADRELQKWVKDEIPALCARHSRPLRHYSARWNAGAVTPELLLPLACPSLVPDNIRQWQRKWADASITVSGTGIDPANLGKAEAYNRRRSSGRLVGFTVGESPLSQVIIEDLQAAIAERFPEHTEIVTATDLQQELDQQEQFLFTGSEGFIERTGDFDALDAYAAGASRQLYVLTAPGGMGKSSLLAKWIDRRRAQGEHAGETLHYRFIGQSDRSTTVYSLLGLLLQELKEASGNIDEEIPTDPQRLIQDFSRLLESAAKTGRRIIVLDALNQLESGLSELSWLPYLLPENIRLIVSLKRGEPDADGLLGRMRGQVILSEVKPFESQEHRGALVNAYLAQYLKQLDQQLLDTLINLPGAANPLYLKVVLSELRVFGAFANLREKLQSDFGETPAAAFQAILKRLESDPAYSAFEPKDAVPLLFGLLAHARHGLSVEELSEIFVKVLGKDKQAAADTIHLYLRQVRPFLAHRSGRYDFFFESFKSASGERYVGEGYARRQAREWHTLLADYFETQALNQRKAQELPWQLAQAANWQHLANQLADGDLLSLAYFDNEYDVKRYWQLIEANSPIRMVRTYRPIIEAGRMKHNFMAALTRLFADTLHVRESIMLREALTDFYRKQDAQRALANSLSHQADLLYKQADLSGALELWREQEQISRKVGDEVSLASSLGNQATVLLNMGNTEGARELAEDAIGRLRSLGKAGEEGLGIFLNTLASIYQQDGKLALALELYGEAERYNRNLGHLPRTAVTIGFRGRMLAELGKLDEAMHCYQEQQQICQDIGDREGLVTSYVNQGDLYWDLKELEKALACYQQTERICREARMMDRLAKALGQQAMVFGIQGRYTQALELSEEAEQLFRDLRDQEDLASCLGNHAIILSEKGDLAEALPLLEEAKRLYQNYKRTDDAARMLLVEAQVYRGLNQMDRAVDCANEALALHYELEKAYRESGNQAGLALALLNQAMILTLKGRYRAALTMAQEAHQIAIEQGLAGLVERARAMIRDIKTQV